MARRTLREARALVTGASSGLGRAAAVALASEGARLVITGRSAPRLAETERLLLEAGARADTLRSVVADLTLEDDRRRLIEAAAEAFDGALDILLQAAGVGAYGRFESHDPSVLRRIFEINFFAPAELARAALPLLRRGRRPIVVHIGSIVARRGLPGRPEYSAGKFALAGLTEALRAEWAIDGIDVAFVNPGFTATPFEDHLLVDTAIYKTRSSRSMTPERVAAAIVRATKAGRNETTLTIGGRTLLLVNRLFPRFVDQGFARWTRRLYADREALRRAERPDESASRLSAPPAPDTITCTSGD